MPIGEDGSWTRANYKRLRGEATPVGTRYEARRPVVGRPCTFKANVGKGKPRLLLVQELDGVTTVRGEGGKEWREPLSALILMAGEE